MSASASLPTVFVPALHAPPADPDWKAIELALPPTAEAALGALRAARRRYVDVKQQLEDLIAYEARQHHQQQLSSAPVSRQPSPPPQEQNQPIDQTTTATAAAVAAPDGVHRQQEQPQQQPSRRGTTATHTTTVSFSLPIAAPRGVVDEMIPSSNLDPRPSHRLRFGSIHFQHQHHGAGTAPSSRLASAAKAAPSVEHGGADEINSPAPRAPQPPPGRWGATYNTNNNNASAASFVSQQRQAGTTTAVTTARADATVPLVYQKRPNLRGLRLRDVLAHSQPPSARASAARDAQQKPASRQPSVIQGFSLLEQAPAAAAVAALSFHSDKTRRRATVTNAAREALLVCSLAGTMILAAWKLRWI